MLSEAAEPLRRPSNNSIAFHWWDFFCVNFLSMGMETGSSPFCRQENKPREERGLAQDTTGVRGRERSYPCPLTPATVVHFPTWCPQGTAGLLPECFQEEEGNTIMYFHWRLIVMFQDEMTTKEEAIFLSLPWQDLRSILKSPLAVSRSVGHS